MSEKVLGFRKKDLEEFLDTEKFFAEINNEAAKMSENKIDYCKKLSEEILAKETIKRWYLICMACLAVLTWLLVLKNFLCN